MTDDEIACEIVLQCRERGPGGSICPSEVARALAVEESAWRELMPRVRHVAAMLVGEGKIAATQKGAPVDPLSARGPIRLALRVEPRSLRRAVRDTLAAGRRKTS